MMSKKEKDYREEEIDSLFAHADHFWFSHRNRMILDTVMKYNPERENTHILELGAGSGNIGRFLKKAGYRIDVSDLYTSALKYFENDVDEAFTFDVVADTIPRNLRNKYNVVILGDVIEHLDRSVSALEKVGGFLNTKGIILITVPALMQLWTPYDEFCGHKRRYDRKSLKSDLTCSKYTLVEMKYFMLVPAVILLFQRKLKSLFKRNEESFNDELHISRIVNKIMGFIMSIEHMLGKIIEYPFGSSLLAVGTKQ